MRSSNIDFNTFIKLTTDEKNTCYLYIIFNDRFRMQRSREKGDESIRNYAVDKKREIGVISR